MFSNGNGRNCMSHTLAIFDDAIVLGDFGRCNLMAARNPVLYSDGDVILTNHIAFSEVSESDCNIVARIKNQNFSHQGATLSNLSELDKGNESECRERLLKFCYQGIWRVAP